VLCVRGQKEMRVEEVADNK